MRRNEGKNRLTYMIWRSVQDQGMEYGTKDTSLTKEEATKVLRRRAASLRTDGTVNCCLFLLDHTPFPGATTLMLGGVGFNLAKQANVDTFR